ncbi:DUF2608 domain-containing protein [Holospora undulata]|uniref:DUF2608 domain-containing protein n=1 Tax=Holospora undulata HU1 TaxID=1321371 RepID=A0A061JFJ9_9PROT|nr:DUF2608 domain-containing protein [Holospora undulata]ETZ04341.1 hypothetical protein K737_301178 [Holospora undulata HU1]
MMKRFFVLICLCLIVLQNSYADSGLTISYIKEISEAVKNADQDTLVVFDVDNVISAPSDLIGRPKARPVRRAVFKEYEQKYGKERAVHIHSLYYLRASEEFVEKEIKEIILGLYARKIPSIALTAMGTGKFGNIDDPMHLRVFRLKEKGILFGFENLNKRILWDDEAGYESGVIFSGKQSKGEALQYFLENIAHWKPKHIIFVDDNLEYLNSMSSMCNRLKIKFTGFHYKAAVFDQDEELSSEIARLQLKTLDEKEIWIPDSEAKEIIEEGKK